ncbi:hypothetical protein B0H13DRAFT_2526039 [Mycena leptocephala]|nr:hypothetical protein B0H13DRAFT_2526039 [Mycena leptocephala]
MPLMPSFPLSNSLNLCDGLAVEQYHSHLETARNLAQLKGLKPGLRYTLDLSIPPANPLPNARSLPLLPPQSHHISLRLQRALQSGVDKFSQVWTAVVETPGAQRAKETTLVLKIIQPSMCPYPGVDDNWGLDYMFPEYIALQEAWVYNQLTHKQGLFIPYFFGMHTIVTPSEESAWVLVLECIPGDTLQTYNKSPTKTLEETGELMKLSIDTLTDFMSDGWSHFDLVPRNIIVTHTQGKRSLVFVDLYSAEFYEPDELDDGLRFSAAYN